MTTPDKCPKCGAGFLQVEKDDWEGHILTYARFKCETTVYEDRQLRLQGHFCIISERDQLASQVVELVDAMEALLARDYSRTCRHEDTHRGGAIWEICDCCGDQWADDEGGKPEWQDPPEWTKAEALIAKHKPIP